jgi:uncharacterized membrane protein
MEKTKVKSNHTTGTGILIGILWFIGMLTALFGNLVATVFFLLSAILFSITGFGLNN